MSVSLLKPYSSTSEIINAWTLSGVGLGVSLAVVGTIVGDAVVTVGAGVSTGVPDFSSLRHPEKINDNNKTHIEIILMFIITHLLYNWRKI